MEDPRAVTHRRFSPKASWALASILAMTGCQSTPRSLASWFRLPHRDAASLEMPETPALAVTDRASRKWSSAAPIHLVSASSAATDGTIEAMSMEPLKELPVKESASPIRRSPLNSTAAKPVPSTPFVQVNESSELAPSPITAPGLVEESPIFEGEPVEEGWWRPRKYSYYVGGYGVNSEDHGLLDNISGRVGGSYLNSPFFDGGGGVAILESSKQLFGSSIFLQAGGAVEFINGRTPSAFTAGLSKLARIEGDRVTKPLVASFAYDGYYDDGFMVPARQDAYLDQFRVLGGWAIRPWLDFGAWGSISNMTDTFAVANPAGTTLVTTGFANRAAGYVGFDLRDFNLFGMQSIGWQESPGGFFSQSDFWVPITQYMNFWFGVGYVTQGWTNVLAGLEFIPVGFVSERYRLWSKSQGSAGGDSCSDVCANVCEAPRYRGGWANGVYRGALRVQTPSQLALNTRVTTDFIPTVPVVLAAGAPPAAGGQTANPPVVVPPAQTQEECPPRILGRPTREGNLSRLLKERGVKLGSPTP